MSRRLKPTSHGKRWVKDHHCGVCGTRIERHELDTDMTYSNREVRSRACMRVLKGTQAERGRMRWTQEAWV